MNSICVASQVFVMIGLLLWAMSILLTLCFTKSPQEIQKEYRENKNNYVIKSTPYWLDLLAYIGVIIIAIGIILMVICFFGDLNKSKS